MHGQNISCTIPFDMGLTSAEGQQLECFIRTTNNISRVLLKSSKPIKLSSLAGILRHPDSFHVYTMISVKLACMVFVGIWSKVWQLLIKCTSKPLIIFLLMDTLNSAKQRVYKYKYLMLRLSWLFAVSPRSHIVSPAWGLS